MSPARKATRARHPPPPSPAAEREPGAERWLRWLLVAVILIPPFVVLPTAKDSFRLPKLMTSEWLGLLSLVPAAWVLGERRADHASPRRWGGLVAVLPLLAVAAISLATTSHPEHARRAVPSLVIGSLCLAGWTASAPRPVLARALAWLALPGAALALLAVLQYHNVFRPFAFTTDIAGERLGVVSLAGNAGDLGAYLVLPCLLAQWMAWRSRGARRWRYAGVALVCVYGLVASQTLTALAALAAGSAVLWALLLPRRQAALAAAAVGLAALLAMALLPPLRDRAAAKLGPLLRGDWNEVLTFRLDAWAAAGWMLRQHPLAGVGFGGYRAEYTNAKEALLLTGRPFSPFALESTFANAHNDVLEVAAELGWPGVVALAWGIVMLCRAAGRAPPAERAPILAGLLAMALVALASFPFEIALVAYPWLTFLAWVLRGDAAAEGAA